MKIKKTELQKANRRAYQMSAYTLNAANLELNKIQLKIETICTDEPTEIPIVDGVYVEAN